MADHRVQRVLFALGEALNWEMHFLVPVISESHG